MQIETVPKMYAEHVMSFLVTALALGTWLIFWQDYRTGKIRIKSWICAIVTTVGLIVTCSGLILLYCWEVSFITLGIQEIGWAISGFSPLVFAHWYAEALSAKFNLKVLKPSKPLIIFQYIVAAVVVIVLLRLGLSDLLSGLRIRNLP